MTCKVLKLFVNTLTADDKYSLVTRENSMQAIQMRLSEKQNSFSEFLCAFFESKTNVEPFKKKVTLIAYEFWKLPTSKNVVR